MHKMNTGGVDQKEGLRGALAAGSSYLLWGLFPLFWKLLEDVDATELIAHRIVWSLFFVALLVFLTAGAWRELSAAFRSWRMVGLHFVSGALLTANWLIYVWAINQGRVIETSLGYYLVPLFNVVLGRLLLHERLTRLQTLAILLAAVGVLLQYVGVGALPWVSLSLGLSFGFYGLLRKRSPLGSLNGLVLETALYTPLAGAFLLSRAFHGEGGLGHIELWRQALLLGSGVVTAVPLLLFAFGARRLRLSTLGLLQYIAPSLSFLLGAFLYGEPVSPLRLASFLLIWAALALYSVDNVLRYRRGIGLVR